MAEVSKLTTAPAESVTSFVIFPGRVRVGAPVSLTITWKAEDPVFPCESVALQVTVVFPIGKVEPDGGAQVTETEPSTLSVAVGSV